MSGQPIQRYSGTSGFDAFSFLARFAPLIFLLVLMAVFSIMEPRFLTPLNLFNVMRQVSIYGLLAIGMTFVILTAGIDLSIGSLLAFAGLVAAAIAKGGLANRFTVGEGQDAVGYGWYLAALGAIAVGVLGGYLQGFAITRLKVPPFVVTLGGMSAFRGAALLFAAGGPISGFQPDFAWWGQGRILTVPVPVIIFLAAALIAHVVLRYTRFGRRVYAVGGNPEAARAQALRARRSRKNQGRPKQRTRRDATRIAHPRAPRVHQPLRSPDQLHRARLRHRTTRQPVPANRQRAGAADAAGSLGARCA